MPCNLHMACAGNIKLKDIGAFLKHKIRQHFATSPTAGGPVDLKLIVSAHAWASQHTHGACKHSACMHVGAWMRLQSPMPSSRCPSNTQTFPAEPQDQASDALMALHVAQY